MTDPYRMKILMIFNSNCGEAMTVKEIASAMGEPHGKVYYHVKKMMDIGALEVVKTQKINGITAKYYVTTFDEIKIDEEGSHFDEDHPTRVDAYTGMISSLFNQFRDMCVDFFTMEGIEDYPYKEGEKTSHFQGGNIYVNEEKYQTFYKELTDVFEKYKVDVKDDEHFEKTFFYSVFTAKENKKG